MLCLLALRDGAARNLLLEQNWNEVLLQIAGGRVTHQNPGKRPEAGRCGVAQFIHGQLSPEEEGLVSAWLMQKTPLNATTVAEQWWKGLRQAALRRQLEIAESRMRLPQLSTGEIVNLQKEIVDLRDQLNQISRLSPVPRAD